jgi:hypothetical protein
MVIVLLTDRQAFSPTPGILRLPMGEFLTCENAPSPDMADHC